MARSGLPRHLPTPTNFLSTGSRQQPPEVITGVLEPTGVPRPPKGSHVP